MKATVDGEREWDNHDMAKERDRMEEVAARLGIETLGPEEEEALLEREGVSSIEEIPAEAEVLVGSWDDVLDKLSGRDAGPKSEG
jgi:hypothetical protein